MLFTERWKTLAEITRHPSNAERRSGALLDYLRWNFGHRVMDAEHVLPLVERARLILSNRQNFATLVYTCGLWDFAEQAFLLHLLRSDDVFVDIGANVGGYTVLASVVTGARSIAFEPVPETYMELRRNVRLNDIESLVQCHCCALGETAGVNRMTSERGGLNHIVSSEAASGTVEVAMDRLDTMLAGASCRLIKLDAEGYELNILRGAPETLASPNLQALIVELNGSGGRYAVSDDDTHGEITRLGFEPCSYNAEARMLTPLNGYNRAGMNTIYIRDRAAVIARLAAAPCFSLRGRSY